MEGPPFYFTEYVLTHQDISPRSLILGEDGLVWLVDWVAGSYLAACGMAAPSLSRRSGTLMVWF